MRHYVYLTCDSISGRLYWGSRSCKCEPQDDPYLGSHQDETYKPDMKWVWHEFSSRQEADDAEDALHKLFDVVNSPIFANLSCRTFRHWEWVGSKHTPQTREKLRQKKLGERNPQYGKPTSQKQKDAVRRASIGRRDTALTAERKRKAQQRNGLENKKGKQLYHDPKTQEQRYFHPHEAPVGWVKGQHPQVLAKRQPRGPGKRL